MKDQKEYVMKNLKVIVHPTSEGLWAEVEALPGCFTQGDNYTHLREMLKEVIDLHVEGLVEDNEEVPEYIIKGLYSIEFKIDLKDLFEEFPLTIKGVAEKSGINRSLLNQYAKGIKTLSEKQAIRIQTAINDIGRDLATLSF